MNLNETRNELSVAGKNGIGFILSGSVIWIIITIIFSLPMGIYEKNIFMLFATGIMFPLSLLISTIIKADWKFSGNPLASLGIYLSFTSYIFPDTYLGNSKKTRKRRDVFCYYCRCSLFSVWMVLYFQTLLHNVTHQK